MNIWNFLTEAAAPVVLIVMSALIIINKTLSDGLIFLAVGFAILLFFFIIEVAWREHMKMTGGPEEYGY